jgi:pilus assembly protein Flp/PilA
LARFSRCSRGATAIEYGLIACLIVLVIVGSLKLVADNTISMYNSINNNVNSSAR